MTDCVSPGKVAHRTRHDAEIAMVSMIKRHGSRDLHVYHCPAGHYHVGHDLARVKWRRMRGRRAVR